MSSVCVSLILAGAIGQFSDEERTRFRDAVSLYDETRYEESAASFQELAVTYPNLATHARFGLGASRIRQAVENQAAPGEANRLLLDAISVYRRILDDSAVSESVAADARHNLELAKRLLNWPDEGSSWSAASSEKSSQQSDDPPTGATAPSEKKPGTNEKPGIETKDDTGSVTRPLPGVGFEDAAPLTRDEAERALTEAIGRIERENASSVRLGPSGRRSASDY